MSQTLFAFGADPVWKDLLFFPGCLLALWLAAMFIGGPLFILARQKFPRAVEVASIDDVLGLPGEVDDYLHDCRTQLEAVGFRSVGKLALPNAVEHVRSFAEMFVQDSSKEAALATFIYGMVQNQVFQRVRLVDLTTRLRGGRVVAVNTSNADEPGAFEPDGDERTFGLPDLKNLRQLTEAHRKLAAAHGEGGRPYSRLDEEFRGDPAAYLAAVFPEAYAKAEKQGLLRFDERRDCWRPTAFGAFKLTWQNLWPFNWLRRAARRRAGRRLMRELDIQAQPPQRG